MLTQNTFIDKGTFDNFDCQFRWMSSIYVTCNQKVADSNPADAISWLDVLSLKIYSWNITERVIFNCSASQNWCKGGPLSFHFKIQTKKCMRGSRGGGGFRTPWDLTEVGSYVDVWWVGEGVQRLFLSCYYNFFFYKF